MKKKSLNISFFEHSIFLVQAFLTLCMTLCFFLLVIKHNIQKRKRERERKRKKVRNNISNAKIHIHCYYVLFLIILFFFWRKEEIMLKNIT
jgi:Na+/H+ antiporter NhaD/arsenite permease-like protein